MQEIEEVGGLSRPPSLSPEIRNSSKGPGESLSHLSQVVQVGNYFLVQHRWSKQSSWWDSPCSESLHQMWAGPGPSSSSPKQWKSDGGVQIYNSVSARLPLIKSKKKQIIQSAAISDWLSAMQNGQGAAEHFSSHQELNMIKILHFCYGNKGVCHCCRSYWFWWKLALLHAASEQLRY